MKSRTMQSGPGRQVRPAFKAVPLAVLIASMSATAPVWAQDSTTIVVTGIRKGIEDAISVKKNSTSIVESVSAEDIGKLPDVSIAESIARLPGLAAQRVAGRAQVISVRGLSPDFATTLLNGREQVSTGDNRSVEFDQYPSELLAAVTIYKTPDAGLVGQGLSGTMDLQTVRPLNFRNRTVALNLRGEKNSIGETGRTDGKGERFSVSYIDQSADRTMGIALGYAHMDSPILERQVGLYEPWKIDGRTGVPAGTYVMDGIKSKVISGTNKRDGLMAVLEWKPSKTYSTVVDVYHSEFERKDQGNHFEVHLGGYNGYGSPSLSWSNVTTKDGVMSGGVASGVYPLVRDFYNSRKDKIDAFGWSNNFKFERWSLLADIGTSKAKRDEVQVENNLQLRGPGNTPLFDSVTLDWSGSGFPRIVPGLNYNDPQNLRTYKDGGWPNGTIYGYGWGKTPNVEDELTSYKLIATIPMGGKFFSDAQVGLNLTDRSKVKHQPEGPVDGIAPFVIDPSLYYKPVNHGYSGTGLIPSWNVPAVIARYMTFNPNETDASWKYPKNWEVNETITTAFVKLNIETEGAIPLRGNLGIQVQSTDQSSDSFYSKNGVKTPVHDGKSYTDVLPSLNLAADLGGDQWVRLALAKQLARARLDQLKSALDFGVDAATGKPGGSGGNAQLNPWRATAFDISYEKYWGNKAYFAAAYFYKDLKTYIYTQTKTRDFTELVTGYPVNPGVTLQTIGNYTAPYNGKGGKLSGFEFSASLPLKMLSPALDGFGVSGSITFNDSSITIEDGSCNCGSKITLPGLSDRVSNLTAYYEKAGFEARVSQRRRSDFVGEIGNFAADRTLRYTVGENIIDAQVGYNFSEGMWRGLGLVLQVNNLTNEDYRTYGGTTNKPYEFIKWGRTVMFGANYKF